MYYCFLYLRSTVVANIRSSISYDTQTPPSQSLKQVSHAFFFPTQFSVSEKQCFLLVFSDSLTRFSVLLLANVNHFDLLFLRLIPSHLRSDSLTFGIMGMWIGLTKKKLNKANLITLQPTNNYLNGTQFRVFRDCKKIASLYYHMRNFYNLIGLELWYFSLI